MRGLDFFQVSMVIKTERFFIWILPQRFYSIPLIGNFFEAFCSKILRIIFIFYKTATFNIQMESVGLILRLQNSQLGFFWILRHCFFSIDLIWKSKELMITKIWGCGCGRVVSAVDFGASGPSLMPGDQRKYQILFHFLLSLLLENYRNYIGFVRYKINYFYNLGLLADI